MKQKRLVRTVSLKFFQDDASGEYGLTHDDTQRSGDGFNAFWDGQGIFHDVFEHAHEFTRYFRGENAMNIGGEMAAMGAMHYYIDELGLYDRLRSGFYSPSEVTIRGTFNLVEEAIQEGYVNYGSTLESGVPIQTPVENSELECIIDAYTEMVKALEFKGHEESKESALAYKESVTGEKIANLHRYGFRMAAKLIPNNWQNCETLRDFKAQWEDFCKVYSAKDLSNIYRGIKIHIYREGDLISWRAVFKLQDGYRTEDVEELPELCGGC